MSFILVLLLHWFVSSMLAFGKYTNHGNILRYEDSPLLLELFNNEHGNYSLPVCSDSYYSQLARAQHPNIELFCRHSPLTTEVVHSASLEAVHDCRSHFRNKRWNCHFERHFLSSGTKHASFVWALASAHALAALVRSCSKGHLSDCMCDNYAAEQRRLASFKQSHLGDHVVQFSSAGSTKFMRSDKVVTMSSTQKVYMRQGCEISQVLRFAIRNVRRYFDDHKHSKNQMNLTQLINSHNRRAGLNLIKKRRKTYCRCHGLSGSCTAKICYIGLHHVGNVLPDLESGLNNAKRVVPSRNKYGDIRKPMRLSLYDRKSLHRDTSGGAVDGKVHVESKKVFGGLEKNKPEKLHRSDLVYHRYSPDYCASNAQLGWPGVAQRFCNLTGIGDEQCSSVCCTDAYHVTSVKKVIRSKCRFERVGFKVHCDLTQQEVKVGRCPSDVYYQRSKQIMRMQNKPSGAEILWPSYQRRR